MMREKAAEQQKPHTRNLPTPQRYRPPRRLPADPRPLPRPRPAPPRPLLPPLPVAVAPSSLLITTLLPSAPSLLPPCTAAAGAAEGAAALEPHPPLEDPELLSPGAETASTLLLADPTPRSLPPIRAAAGIASATAALEPPPLLNTPLLRC